MRKGLVIVLLALVLVGLTACLDYDEKSDNENTIGETEIADSDDDEDRELTDLEVLNHPRHVKLFDDVEEVEEFW